MCASVLIARLALLAAIAAITFLTLSAERGPHDLELRPFRSIGPALAHPLKQGPATDATGNVLLFLPFGALLCSLRWRFACAALAGLAFSISVELTQLTVPGRTTSVDDVILNTLGTAAGWGCVVLLQQFVCGLHHQWKRPTCAGGLIVRPYVRNRCARSTRPRGTLDAACDTLSRSPKGRSEAERQS